MDIDTHNELETKAGIPLDAVVKCHHAYGYFLFYKVRAEYQRLRITIL